MLLDYIFYTDYDVFLIWHLYEFQHKSIGTKLLEFEIAKSLSSKLHDRQFVFMRRKIDSDAILLIKYKIF